MGTLSLSLSYENKPVRCVGTPDRPEWIGIDACAAMSIKNARDALASIPEDEKGVAIADTPGGRQEVLTITEAGLYRLISIRSIRSHPGCTGYTVSSG
ncbi:MAG: Bro-N domain-containing protein, partial [Gemmataceae bacterium]|nr:Bro-N domain-containing protein [Gemmataceae bacterium]